MKKGRISTTALRDEFRKDPALSIHASDPVLIRAITQGIQQGDYVYRRGEPQKKCRPLGLSVHDES